MTNFISYLNLKHANNVCMVNGASCGAQHGLARLAPTLPYQARGLALPIYGLWGQPRPTGVEGVGLIVLCWSSKSSKLILV